MAQLGYTWYPQDWWTSVTFKRLKRLPMVRYALRELFDLMYKEGGPVEMNRDFLFDDFHISLTDDEYDKLMQYIEIHEGGKWWIKSIRKRISKAEAARENGKKGGRPTKPKNLSNKPKISYNNKTQKPSEKTQGQNPRNPSLERERERERETKVKEKVNEARASDFLKTKKEIEFSDFEMQNRKSVKDWHGLLDSFNDKIDIEISQGKIDWKTEQLMPRFRSYFRSWKNNEEKPNIKNNPTPAPDSFESGKQRRI